MAPMVATVAEAAEFAEAGARRAGSRPGVMVEVPSAALLAHRMLEVVDFLSIGTNDLTQYTMAADRMATDLAHLTDAWQPAVLQLIAITAEAGQAGRQAGRRLRRGRGRPAAGVRPGRAWASRRCRWRSAAVRPVGARLAAVSMDTCEDAAEAALAATDPMAARAATRARLLRAASRDGDRTPLSTALPETSSSAGSVRSLIDAPGSSAACAQPGAVDCRWP